MTIYDSISITSYGLSEAQANKNLLECFQLPSALSPEECDQIIALSKNYELIAGTTFGSKETWHRKCDIRWIHLDDKSIWLFNKLKDFVRQANNVFKLDLTGFNEALQFTEYKGNGSKYGSHIDMGPNYWHRKISIIIQLSDPNDYTGGDLQVDIGGANRITTTKERGSVVLFPSFLSHNVEPIQSGDRYSLVCWASGPPWR